MEKQRREEGVSGRAVLQLQTGDQGVSHSGASERGARDEGANHTDIWGEDRRSSRHNGHEMVPAWHLQGTAREPGWLTPSN